MTSSRLPAIRKERRERPQLAFLDDIGQWIATGIVLYTIGISALAFNGSPIPESINQMTQAHHTAGVASMVMAMLSFSTGYVEHHRKWLLLGGFCGVLLQAAGTTGNAECCLNLIALFRPTDNVPPTTLGTWLVNLAPLAGNLLLCFAYSANRRARVYSNSQ
jgi:hypothetical protein